MTNKIPIHENPAGDKEFNQPPYVITRDKENLELHVLHTNAPMMAFKVHDVTDLSEPELLQFKRETMNYATIEIAGRYYMLTIAAIFDNIEYANDLELAEKVNSIMLGAGDFYYDQLSYYSN
jgi:hypothetical protein